MAWWKILVLIAAFFSECTSKKSRILNGRDANIEDFPYQVSLRYRGFHLCGGSIISERHILTAAHCTRDENVVPPLYLGVRVVTGTSYRSKKGHTHKIDKIQEHSNYSANENRAWNDIAIITLKDKIIFNNYQQKINLPEYNPEAGQKVNLTGWGSTQESPLIIPRKLQQLQTQLEPNENCQKKVIDPATNITDTEICTLDADGTGFCNGDSGSPLAADGVLLGIAAWIDGDYCGTNTPTVYTNVYKFKDFIESSMNDVA